MKSKQQPAFRIPKVTVIKSVQEIELANYKRKFKNAHMLAVMEQGPERVINALCSAWLEGRIFESEKDVKQLKQFKKF